MIQLRPYQDELVSGIRVAMRQHRRVLAVAPTGAGKTVVFTYIASNAAAKNKRIYIIAHRIEIVIQISAALDRMGVRHGRIWPGNTQTGDLVQVAMAQTLARRLENLPHPDLLVIDECVSGDAVIDTDVGPVRLRDVPTSKARLVMSYDGTGVVWRNIVGWKSSGLQKTLRLHMDGGSSIVCTPDHLLYVGGQWIEARLVKVGMQLTSNAGSAHADAARPCSVMGEADQRPSFPAIATKVFPNSIGTSVYKATLKRSNPSFLNGWVRLWARLRKSGTASTDRLSGSRGEQPGFSSTASNSMCPTACVTSLATVTRIEDYAHTDVYDISVDETHCFFANGLLVHNCHHAVAGQWDAIAKHYPSAKILGVTATPCRLDGKGLGNAFDEMVIGPKMRWLIDNKFLADYEYLAPPQQADFSSVKTRMGDYAIDDLAEIMDQATITGDAVATYAKHLNGRPAIVFCITVAHAEHVAEQFRASGWRAASVDGSMEKGARKNLIASIGDGRLNVLTSCQIISEGTDIPAVAGAIMLRPTKSVSLYLQSAGRALRPKEDGSKAIIIDHVGNVYRHGMPCEDRAWSLTTKQKKEKAPSVAQCEKCFRAFASAPGWKASEECANGKPDGCILNEKPVEKAEIKQVEGELVAVTAAVLAEARKKPLREVLKTAQTEDDLKQIAAERGYKRGWVGHILRERAARHA